MIASTRTHVDIGGQVRPHTLDTVDDSLTTEDTLSSDFQGDTRDFTSKDGELLDHRVDRVFQYSHFSFGFNLDSL